MRKTHWLALALALLCAALLLFSSCSCNPTPTPEPEVKTVTVTFDYRDGSEAVTTTIEEGEIVEEPTAPARTDYDFGGWFTDAACTTPAAFGKIEENTTFYALWVPHNYVLIRFDTCGGAAIAPVAVKRGELLPAPEDPTREGYTFAGWFTDSEGTAPFRFSESPAESMTLYAVWRAAEGYRNVYGYVDGKLVARTVVREGEALTALSVGEEYLCNWYADEGLAKRYDFSAPVNDDLYLYGDLYSAGLTIADGTVLSYAGAGTHVIVPAKWEGKAVTAIGAHAFKGCASLLTVKLPDSIKTVGTSAFSGCVKLQSVNLTAGCTSVGAYAFSRCERLVSFGTVASLAEIADGTFLGCGMLEEITVSPDVTAIGAYAFSGCGALTTLELGDKILSIGEYAFSDCTSLAAFHIPRALEELGNGALTGCSSTVEISGGNRKYKVVAGNLYGEFGTTLLKYVPGEKGESTVTLPGGVTTIAANAFYGNDTLKTLDLRGITLEAGALAGMRALEELTMDTLPTGNPFLAYFFGAPTGTANGSTGVFVPASLHTLNLASEQRRIEDNAFYGCTGLKTVTGISSVRYIGAGAFAYTAIETLKIPATVTAIGEGAFNRCESLRSLEIEADNRAYAAFDGCLYDKSLRRLLVVPRQKTTIAFPDSVTEIASGAFFRSGVKEVVVPASVKTIGAGAFAEAAALEHLSVPFIGASATENTYMLYIFGGTIRGSKNADGSVDYSADNTGAAPATLKKLTVTGTLTAVPDFAFAYLEDTAEFALTGEITAIGMYAYYRTAPEVVKIPATVTQIGDYAFASMSNLKEVTVPGSVGAGLGIAVFYSNSALEIIRFEEGVTVIPRATCYPYTARDSTTGNTIYSSSLKEVYLPASLVEIGEMAFAYMGTYTSGTLNTRFSDELRFTLPANGALKMLGKGAFYMSSVKNLTLPATLEEVGELCFAFCGKLANIAFGNEKDGSALKTLGAASFVSCTGLDTMTIYKKVTATADLPELVQFQPAEEVSYNVFENASVPRIYVYGVALYQKAPYWDDYDKQLFEIGA